MLECTGSADRQTSVELVSQSISDAKPRVFSHLDINVLCSLLALAPVSLCVSERHWASLCRSLSYFALIGRLGRRRRKKVERGLRTAYSDDGHILDAVCRDLEAHQLELRLQILREQLRHDWKPKVVIKGASHLDAALSAGRGTILWISRFAFADTVAKYALHRMGHQLVHLSAPMHGFSTSWFGRRWLNPIQQRMENRYLAERVVLHSHSPTAAMRRLHGVLHGNGIVSVAVYSKGAYAVEAPFMRGRWRIATGAPTLAWKTGAHLLPVFVVRDPHAGCFDFTVDEPLLVDRASPKDEAQKRAVARYLERLEPYVAANPGQWLGWPSVRVAQGASLGKSVVTVK